MHRFLAKTVFGALALAAAMGCGSPAPVESTRRECALLASCPELAFGLLGNDVTNGGTCFAAQTRPSAGTQSAEAGFQLDCARTSNTCTAYRDCVSRSHGADYCVSHPGLSCDGNVVVHCPNQSGSNPPALNPRAIVPTQDCALDQGECHAQGNTAVCTTSTDCDPTAQGATQPHCNGDRVVVCDPTVRKEVVSADCALQGQMCATTQVFGQSISACVPSGAACQIPANAAAEDLAHCDGNTLVTCQRDPRMQPNSDGSQAGNEVRVTCTTDAFRGHCGTVHGVAACVPDDNDCAPSSPDRCRGDTLEICVNGHYEGTACGSLGFARCSQLTFQVAACTNNDR